MSNLRFRPPCRDYLIICLSPGAPSAPRVARLWEKLTGKRCLLLFFASITWSAYIYCPSARIGPLFPVFSRAKHSPH